MPAHKLTEQAPINPPAPWTGGKRLLSKTIIQLINQTPHKLYCEPFVGMGGVFFRRNQIPKHEVINDRSGDVVNLFRILQRHYPQFMDIMKFQIVSRREFERLSKAVPETLTDLERAARFIYLQKLAFGGKVSGQTFGVQYGRPTRFNIPRIAQLLDDICDRLAGVVIENLDWQDCIGRYDRKGALFYLDPPYLGHETDYGEGMFGREDFATMADRLAKLKGTFIMSINDRPEIRETFSKFTIKPVKLHYSVCSGGRYPAKELIISG